MRAPIEVLFGKSAARILLYLHHHGEGYARGIAADLDLTLGGIQHQLKKLESAGVLTSKRVGRTLLFHFNPKSPAARKLTEFVDVFYGALSLAERERLFHERRRPRRAGKQVIHRERPT